LRDPLGGHGQLDALKPDVEPDDRPDDSEGAAEGGEH
jgi:hypothetical protein